MSPFSPSELKGTRPLILRVVSPSVVDEICRGKRGISAEMAVKLSMALGDGNGYAA
jgi:hypothetical protein